MFGCGKPGWTSSTTVSVFAGHGESLQPTNPPRGRPTCRQVLGSAQSTSLRFYSEWSECLAAPSSQIKAFRCIEMTRQSIGGCKGAKTLGMDQRDPDC